MDSQTLADLELPTAEVQDDNIRKLVETTRCFKAAEPGGRLHDFFEEHANAEGVVILDANEAPLGLVMRNDYYQKLGALYGRDLFVKRPVRLIMNSRPLVVDVNVDIATISMVAMNRPPKELYDMVVVTENEAFLGVVSIKRFMVELSRNREKEIELLKKQKEILRMVNETEVRHRQQIEEKSNELREKNDAIKNLLDNAGQGFLSFGPDLLVSEEHSLECVQIFRGPIGGKSFLDLISRHVDTATLDLMRQVFDNVFQAVQGLQQKVYLSLLPTEFTIYNAFVRIEYKITQHAEARRIMLILTDITEKRELEQKMELERGNLRMVVKALAKQSDVRLGMEEFARFVGEDAAAIIDAAQGSRAALNEIFRLIHTYKGDFAQLGLHNTAAQLHEIEDGLARLTASPDAVSKADLLALAAEWSADAILDEDRRIIKEALGRGFFETEERFLVSKDALLAIEQRVAEALPENERKDVLTLLRSLRRHNVKDLLKPYDEYLQTLAMRLEKAVEPLPVTGDDVFIDKDVHQRFFKSLVHVFRNMIDHGVESPEERLEAGKREMGVIECRVRLTDDGMLRIGVADDGRGIDVERVRAKAVAKGMLSEAEAAALDEQGVFALLFADSLSTKDEVSALSGRGMGLSAVKAEVDRLGGSIEIKSRPGQGSKFRFILPLIEE